MKKVLVTGADGFIGSHLVDDLVAEGYEVRALVQYNSMNSWGWLERLGRETRDSIDVHPGDIRDPMSARSAVEGCEAVIHLAALIAIPYSYLAPQSYLDTNATGTLNLLEAARVFGVKRFIHTSTSEVYGSARYVPIDEMHPIVGQSPYSASKIAGDQIAYSYFASFGTPVTIVRPFNTYGPRQSARAVIPTIVTQIAEGREELRIGSTTPTRDFTYVTDTVRGFILALRAPDAVGEVINLGSSFEISIGETAKLIGEIMGVKIQFTHEESRVRPANSEVTRLFADNAKALRLLGWAPNYALREGFKRGLMETIDWFSRPENRCNYKDYLYNI